MLCNSQWPVPVPESPFWPHEFSIFRDWTRSDIAIPYLDDIIVPAADEGEAVANLKTIVKRCEEYGLIINLKKCCL